jgi:hypothetical protein
VQTHLTRRATATRHYEPERAERIAEALDFRKKGYSYPTGAMGVSVSTAHDPFAFRGVGVKSRSVVCARRDACGRRRRYALLVLR